MAKESKLSPVKVRKLFPEVCKWYMPEAGKTETETETEIRNRAKRFNEQGVSPCHECPLCAGEHEH
ncbi:MAG: hypothetical protein Q7R34_08355 [Dehalococcoidia bacterium]|nr:hypothetical protein [Dehalococcoidia bacterium]